MTALRIYREALERIAKSESGDWGWIAHDALRAGRAAPEPELIPREVALVALRNAAASADPHGFGWDETAERLLAEAEEST